MKTSTRNDPPALELDLDEVAWPEPPTRRYSRQELDRVERRASGTYRIEVKR